MNQLNSGLPTPVEAKVVEQKVLGGGDDVSFCSECGTKVTKEIKFLRKLWGKSS